MEAKDRAEIIRKAFDDKKASDIEVINVADKTTLAEYFVICACSSSTQVKACADEAEEKAKEAGFPAHHIEGYQGAAWILLDFGDVVAHVMTKETREFYDIERLWQEL